MPQKKVVSMIDAVLTIVGGFHDLRCLVFFCIANRENIFSTFRYFWFAMQKIIKQRKL